MISLAENSQFYCELVMIPCYLTSYICPELVRREVFCFTIASTIVPSGSAHYTLTKRGVGTLLRVSTII